MATITADGYATVLEYPTATMRVQGSTGRIANRSTPAVWSGGHLDQLVIVTAVAEQPLAELRSAVIQDPTWVLNGIGTLDFTCDANDPTLLDCLVDSSTLDLDAAELSLIGREVQWWRDGELRWAGPVVVADVDLGSATVTCQCFDLGWYLSRRFMGAAERKDLLSSVGQMDAAGIPGWSREGSATATRSTTERVRGVGSARVIGSGAITASFVHPAQTEGQDGTVYLTAMVRLPDGIAADSWVASISAVPSDGSTVYRPGEYNRFVVRDDTATESWIRVSAFCYMRPGRTNTVTVALWSTSGSDPTFFDDVRAQKNDTTGIPVPGADLTTHGVAIVNHAQNGRGKGTFGFRTQVLTTSGTTEVLGERHQNHNDVIDVFGRYVDRDDGWDWWVDPQTRTVVFAARRGQDHTDVAIESQSVLAGGWGHDESQKASAVVVLGEGDGVERPEGSYVSTTTTAGLVLDKLVRPANNTPLSALDPLARSIHQQESQPQTTFRPIRVPADWWTEYGVGPGDTFAAGVKCGVLRPSVPTGGFRVQRMTHDLEADQLELV
ncbi:MAG: hypothetical protein H6515_12915 [Microthrixaceae bacterium]|nr:hypothetical protein [Microthrixaceae bacterium]